MYNNIKRPFWATPCIKNLNLYPTHYMSVLFQIPTKGDMKSRLYFHSLYAVSDMTTDKDQ